MTAAGSVSLDALRKRVRTWLSQVDPEVDSAPVEEAARSWLSALASGGWLRYAVPSAFGGASARVLCGQVCVIREELAYASGLADVIFAMQGLGSYPVTLAGSASLKKKALPRVASGELASAFMLTEREAGSDPSGIATRARKAPGGYRIDGEKILISNAPILGAGTLFARTPKGITAFWIASDWNGLRLAERTEVIAPHLIGTLRMENLRVPAASRIGAEGEGLRLALATLGMFRPTVGAAALGMARRAFDEAVLHVRGRKQFGKPLSEFQAVRMKLAEMKVEIETMRLAVEQAARAVDEGTGEARLFSSIAKLHATEGAQRVIDSAVQLLGGAGVTVGNPVERLYREIRPLRIYEGTSDIQKLIIARELLAPFEKK